MGNAHASRGGRGNRRGRRGPPRSGPSQAQNATTPIRQNPSTSGSRPSAEIVLPAAHTNGANGPHTTNDSNGHTRERDHERQPSQPEREPQAPEAARGPDPVADTPFVLTPPPPASERTSPYRFVGERRMLPHEANRPRPTSHPNGAAEPSTRPAGMSAPDAEDLRPGHMTRRSDLTHAPLATTNRDDTTPAEEDDGDESWTLRPRGDVRGDVGPLIDALHEVFVHDRAVSSQGGSTRCGICYLHFPFSELEYREAEGYYVCAGCKRALGPARLPMVRKQRRG